MSQPVVEGSLGSPPFEKPNIEQVTKALSKMTICVYLTLNLCIIMCLRREF